MEALLIVSCICVGLAMYCLKLLDTNAKLNQAGYQITKKFIDVIEGKAVATIDRENFIIKVKYHDEEKEDERT